MSYEADDRSILGADDATQEQTTSKAIDSNQASKVANMLEGLRTPPTKEQIRKHVADGGAIALRVENGRNTSRYIDDNPQDGRKYNNTYETEMTLGLAVERNNAQSRNKERVGKNFQRKKSKKWRLCHMLRISDK